MVGWGGVGWGWGGIVSGTGVRMVGRMGLSRTSSASFASRKVLSCFSCVDTYGMHGACWVLGVGWFVVCGGWWVVVWWCMVVGVVVCGVWCVARGVWRVVCGVLCVV